MQLLAIAKKYINRLPTRRTELEQIETDIEVADYFGYPADTRQLEELIADIRNSLRPLKPLYREIVAEIEAYYRPSYCIRVDLCCGAQMTSDDEYHLICQICGRVHEIIIPTKIQPRVTRRCYEQIIYFKKNLYIILCIDKNTVHSDTIPRVRDYIKRHNIARFNIYIIREILKSLGLQNQYKFAPKIMASITGEYPPYYTPTEIVETLRLYNQITYAIGQINFNSQRRHNMCFYNYFIFRIFYALFDDSRAHTLFRFVYMPDEQSIIQLNSLWEEICAIVGMSYQKISGLFHY